MESVWIYKRDGTRQCGLGREISLDDMKAQLETLGVHPLRSEKRTLCEILPTVCGAPTGQVNAYEITKEDAFLLFHGFPGPMGFKLWTCDDHIMPEKTASVWRDEGPEVPFPFSNLEKSPERNIAAELHARLTSVTTHPVMIRELIGRRCRVYKEGDQLTLDFRPTRVNIELDESRQISEIWFG